MNGERRKRRLRPWMIVLGLLAALLAYMYWPAGPVKIIISRETTYIDGPLNPDGTPNYVAYLDANYSQGVTPENNAAPLLLRAIGPDLLPDEVREETLRRLDLPRDFFDRDKHFVMWQDRTRLRKGGATMPAQSDGNDAPDDEDVDDGPSLKELRDMLLAGQVHPELEAWLARNAGPLDLVRQAADKDRFYLPFISTSNPPSAVQAILSPRFKAFNNAVESLTLRALRKADGNDLPGAWDDVLAAHRLARLMGQSPSLIGRLVAAGLEGYAARTGIDLATRYPLPAGLARTVLAGLAALEPFRDIVATMDECERFFALDSVMMISRGGGWKAITAMSGPIDRESKPLDLDYNQMLRDINSWYDRVVEPLRIPFCQGRQQACEAFDDEIKSQLKTNGGFGGGVPFVLLRYGGRPFRGAFTTKVTNMALAILMPTVYQATVLDERTKANGEIETVAAALACFRAETGRWPAELAELCPSPLKTIPADRFSGKPLIYRPNENGYLVYCIGDNLRDDGGQWNLRGIGDEKKDDIAAQVKPAETQAAETKPATSQP